MDARIKTVAVLVALSLALPGCSSIFGSKAFAGASSKANLAAPSQALTAAATDLGRHHLETGNYGQAIEAFQVAIANQEPVAPAFNGLGVAFARLGRFELAQRYFERAAAIAPEDTRFQDNLARLTRSPAFAMRHQGDIAAGFVTTAAADPVVKAAMRRAEAPTAVLGKLQRQGRGQVFIQTVQPMTAPARTAAAAVDSRFRPLLRNQLAAVGTTPETIASPRSGAAIARIVNFRPMVRFALPPARD